MIPKTIDAVELKRRLQSLAEEKLEGKTPAEQIEYLRQKFGDKLTIESAAIPRR
jgi:hypothetical protein